MSQIAESTNLTSDRVKLPLLFNADKMLEEIKQLNLTDFIYYNVLQLRGPAHFVNPALPAPLPADDFADGTWTEWLDTGDLLKSSYMTEVVDTFRQHTRVTLVRLLRLAPGAVVKEHTDPTLGLEIPKSVIRLTIPILTNDDVAFMLNGTAATMQPGECWYLRLTDPHSIVNNSPTERINMSIDMAPNDWVRSMILKSDVQH